LAIVFPVFVDNQRENTLASAVKQAWASVQANGGTVGELCIATGFFNLGGYRLLAEVLEAAPRVRILLGVEPRPEAERPLAAPGQTPEELLAELLREQHQSLEEGLRRQRDLLPFDREEDTWVRRLLKWLYSGRVEVRRQEERILHAKAYLFRTAAGGILVGSSNLTWGGLAGNLELNLGTQDPILFQQACQWFEELWERARPFDLAKIYDRLMEEFPPYWIYLRVLLELYEEQLAEEEKQADIPLTEFQKHGVWRALRIMNRYGGALVADSVGLGKTYIAGEIARRFIERKQRVLLVCPAALRDSTWEQFLHQYQLFAEVVSFEQLGEEKQLSGTREYLRRPVEEYALVIVDEAHHYRNPGTPKREVVLRRLIRKAGYPQVLLLTATPVNNSLWDLYYLLRYFVRQDSALAERGVLSLRQRFEQAMAEDPFDLEPDLLFPVLDATTVKRTRGFIKREYPNEQIRLPNQKLAQIRFPRPVLRTIRYEITPLMRALLDELESALAPQEGSPQLSMARYQPEQYLRAEFQTEETRRENPVVGLWRTGLLKRFESSLYAFRCTVERLIQEHEVFLKALDGGKVLKRELLKEISASGDEVDDQTLAEILADSPRVDSLARYDAAALRQAVQSDLQVLRSWRDKLANLPPRDDPKLRRLAEELAQIARQARQEALDGQDQRRKRKVIVFSAFEDTIDWIESFLQEELATNPALQDYQGRMAAISGNRSRGGRDREQVIKEFAPSAAGEHERLEDRFDLLLSTDIIAEGMNLQDCRNIINFDLPWNPMRLVQRHGRIDRITSPHREIYLRTFFPPEELERLLDLDERIRRKLAQAAASVGVETPPIAQAPRAERAFAETRQEIHKLLAENPELFEEGGRRVAALSSEEYRAKLRKGLEKFGEEIKTLPWKAGSGMLTRDQPGYVFLARVGVPGSQLSRSFLRFVALSSEEICREVGTCLRLIQCEEDTPRVLPDRIRVGAFDAWQRARQDIWNEWMAQTDPANLQPKLRPLNHRVAEFLRNSPPPNMPQDELDLLLRKVLSPWSYAMEREIREIFDNPELENSPDEKAKQLAEKITELGIEPFQPIKPLPPIEPEEIHLVCWMALVPAATDSQE
jgi:superfamily II DNA or RNA helicase